MVGGGIGRFGCDGGVVELGTWVVLDGEGKKIETGGNGKKEVGCGRE